MTRINCIPVEELHDKHLVAEYRELPRIFKLARLVDNAPRDYVLGTGHMKFFYNKLEYLYKRQLCLVEEMKRRGFKPTYSAEDLQQWSKFKPNLWNDWTPTEEAMALNRARINRRLQEMKYGT